MIAKIRALISRLRGLFAIRRLDSDFAEELESHFTFLTEENIRQGMSTEEAKRNARLKLGSQSALRESHHDQRTIAWLESLAQDIRFAARMLRKNPSFTIVAIFTLALGIGANTAIFSVVDAVLLKSLPFPDGQRIVVFGGNAGPILNTLSDSPNDLLGWQPHVQSFEAVAAYQPGQINLTGDGDPATVLAAQVSPEFFNVLGVAPALGRNFPAEPAATAPGVILSWSLWRYHYNADSGILGKPVEVNGRPVTILGVMPRGFQFPEGAEIWVPKGVGDDTIDRGVILSNLIARLKKGISLDQARAEMNGISARSRSQSKLLTTLHANATLTELQVNLTAKSRTPLFLLLGAVACVLLIACANVANLAFCRATNRQSEFAIRSAIGAGRPRLVRQLLTESTMVALIGGLLGVLIAFATRQFLIAILPFALPKFTPITIQGRVLAFTALLCCASALLSGLAPALGVTRIDLWKPLKNSGSISGSRGHNRIRGAMLVVQIALSFILLIGAGLMIRTLAGLLKMDVGFDPRNVVTLDIPLSQAAYPAQPQVSSYFDQVFARLKSVPGVDSVGAINYLPLGGTPFFLLPVSTPDHPFDKSRPFGDVASFFTVAGDYFPAMRIPLLRGRNFSSQDGPNTTRVAIVNESLALRFWPGQDPISSKFSTANQTFVVVGEVGDVHHASLQQSDELEMYFPQSEMPTPVMDLAVRFDGNPEAMIPVIRSEILAVDKNQQIASVQTMESVVGHSLSTQRSDAYLLGVFGFLALTLAATGCYGVVAYSVAQRTHEIGIRIAVGARPRDVLRLAIGSGMVTVFIGVALGVCGALALTRLLSTLLFGVTATDPLTFAATSVVLIVATLVACYIPARRAMRVDPMVAFRHE